MTAYNLLDGVRKYLILSMVAQYNRKNIIIAIIAITNIDIAADSICCNKTMVIFYYM